MSDKGDNVIKVDAFRVPQCPESPRELTATDVLIKALEADLVDMVVVGWTRDGELYAASTSKRPCECLELFENFKAVHVVKVR
jgi:hypothetical protein